MDQLMVPDNPYASPQTCSDSEPILFRFLWGLIDYLLCLMMPVLAFVIIVVGLIPAVLWLHYLGEPKGIYEPILFGVISSLSLLGTWICGCHFLFPLIEN
jgi:hypothetical protein